jgi:hypothetical protein
MLENACRYGCDLQQSADARAMAHRPDLLGLDGETLGGINGVRTLPNAALPSVSPAWTR